MKNIEALIDDGGEITLGAIGGIGCAATAADGHNCVAMLAPDLRAHTVRLPGLKHNGSRGPPSKPALLRGRMDWIAKDARELSPVGGGGQPNLSLEQAAKEGGIFIADLVGHIV